MQLPGYLTLDADSAAGQWDIALRDLEYVLGLDGDRDGVITWGELRTQTERVQAYVFARIALSADGLVCRTAPAAPRVDRHSDGAYVVFEFAIECPGDRVPDMLAYRLFFDLDPTHRGLVKLRHSNTTTTAVLSPDRPDIVIAAAAHGAWHTFTDYWREGIRHIWVTTLCSWSRCCCL